MKFSNVCGSGKADVPPGNGLDKLEFCLVPKGARRWDLVFWAGTVTMDVHIGTGQLLGLLVIN